MLIYSIHILCNLLFYADSWSATSICSVMSLETCSQDAHEKICSRKTETEHPSHISFVKLWDNQFSIADDLGPPQTMLRWNSKMQKCHGCFYNDKDSLLFESFLMLVVPSNFKKL